ncbi:MAG: hypothetical protein K2Y37_27290 [Pirellulales bacterium]|nr:hypothetical protein [Pirellulales bacterium]
MSGFLHALQLLGTNATVVDHASGKAHKLLDIVVGRPDGSEIIGSMPIFRTRYGARFRSYRKSLLSEVQADSQAHAGQALAVLGALGVPLTYPIDVGDRSTETIDAIYRDMIANFCMKGELYWDAEAIIRYGPPNRTWTNKFGEIFSFDDLAEELLSREYDNGSCGGTHRLRCLAILIDAHARHSLVSKPIVADIVRHMAGTVEHLVTTQDPSGCWEIDWWYSLSSKRPAHGRATPTALGRLVATGHHVEWLLLLAAELRPSRDTLARAGSWLVSELQARVSDPTWVAENYCPVVHATRAVLLLGEASAEQLE